MMGKFSRICAEEPFCNLRIVAADRESYCFAVSCGMETVAVVYCVNPSLSPGSANRKAPISRCRQSSFRVILPAELGLRCGCTDGLRH